MSEVVLLVEPDGASEKIRARTLLHPINVIIERCALDPTDPTNPAKQWVRRWVNTDGERDLTGRCRVFREELPPPVEEKENPIYQETVLKEPLKFGVDKATFVKIGKKLGKK